MSKLTLHGAKAATAATAKSDIVVVPLFKNEDLSRSSSEINAAAGDVLQRAITIGDADAKLGKITTMVGSGNITRIMSVGCGDRASFNLEAQLSVTGAVSRALASSKAKNAIVVGDPIADDKDALTQFLEFLGRDMAMACYHYTATLGTPKPGPTFSKLTVAVDGISAAKAKQSLSVGATIGNGANLTLSLIHI